jgi:hypothetical protein
LTIGSVGKSAQFALGVTGRGGEVGAREGCTDGVGVGVAVALRETVGVGLADGLGSTVATAGSGIIKWRISASVCWGTTLTPVKVLRSWAVSPSRSKSLEVVSLALMLSQAACAGPSDWLAALPGVRGGLVAAIVLPGCLGKTVVAGTWLAKSLAEPDISATMLDKTVKVKQTSPAVTRFCQLDQAR